MASGRSQARPLVSARARPMAGGASLLIRGLPIACGTLLGACAGTAQAWPASALALVAWAYAAGARERRLASGRLGASALGIVAMQLVGHAWLLGSPLDTGASGLAWGVAALVVAAGVQAAWIAGCALLLRRSTASLSDGPWGTVIAGLAWSLGWGCADALRQLGRFGDGYALLGTSFVDFPGVAAALPVLGLSTTTTILAAAAWLAARAVHRALAHRAWLTLALGLTVLAAGAASWPGRPAADPRAARGFVPVAAIQLARDKRADWNEALRDAQQERLLAALRALPAGGVAVTPETYFPEPRPRGHAPFWDALDAATVDGRHAIVGMPVRFVPEDGGRMEQVNALVDYAPSRVSVYAKERLVPGVEFMPDLAVLAPLRQAIFGRGRPEHPGPDSWHQPLFAADAAIGASICHELAFELLMARRARSTAWLLNASEDGWLHSAAYERQMLAIARVRALEAGKALLRVSNMGTSALIGSDGRWLERAPARTGTTAMWQVPEIEGDSFHTRHADVLFFLPCFGALLLLIAGTAHRFVRPAALPPSFEGNHP